VPHEEDEMNPYARVGAGLETTTAATLRARLMAWHDAMVAHERRLRTSATTDICHDDCPHAVAGMLWAEALAMLGPEANTLTFLRSRARSSTSASLERAS
jgi:hypothetical protein